MTAHRFLWLDLETTGLVPAKGRILEFAAVLCEDAAGDDFAVVEQYSGVVHYAHSVLEGLAIDDYVLRMHDSNDLWADVDKSTTTLREVDEFMTALADRLTGGKLHQVVLAGSSVHFDHKWCEAYLLQFREYLSHRVFDVSTLTRAAREWGAPVEWPVRNAHRALPDILATIDEARAARASLLGGAA
jgi:oligoribonuclease